MKTAPSAHTVLFRLLLAVLVLAPLPLGSNRPWAADLLCAAIGLLAAAWGALALVGRAWVPVPARRLWPVALPFLAVLAWGLVQSLGSLPVGWAHPVWAEIQPALTLPVDAAVSPAPAVTRAAVLRLACYGLVFLLAVQWGRDGGRARLGLKVVTWAVLAQCAYGLSMHMAGIERILWLEKLDYIGDATGTFVNRNAFGAVAGLGVLLCLAWAFERTRARTPVSRRGEALERFVARSLPWQVAALLPMLALLSSHSRGALLATAGASVVLIAAAVAARLLRPGRAVLLVLVLAAIGLGLMVSTDTGTLIRMAGEKDLSGDRPNLVRLALQAIADAPLVGHGLGAFLWSFAPYRDLAFPRPVSYSFAHNVWLETLMDLGYPAALALLASLLVAVVAAARGVVVRRQSQIHGMVAVAAATLFGLHGVVDFSVQMPANAALLAFLLGLGYAQAWSTRPASESA